MSHPNLNQSSSEVLSEVRQDFIVSWRLFKENWKAFLATEIFAFLAFIIIAIGLGTIVLYFLPFLPTIKGEHSRGDSPFPFDPFTFTIGFLILLTFLACQYGLAYDIISSGDMFAEFKGSFTYYRKHWVSYPILTFIVGWVQFFKNNMDLVHGESTDDVLILILTIIGKNIFHYIWFVLIIGIFPSITAQGSFKESIKENFMILRRIPLRLFSTWGIFLLVFCFPSIFLSLIISLLSEGTMFWYVASFLFAISALFGMLIGPPMAALIATRIYSSIEFEDSSSGISNQESQETNDPSNNLGK